MSPASLEELELPDIAFSWVQELLEVRAGGGRAIDGIPNAGMIGFPSFHCVCSLLFVWALWEFRIARDAAILTSGAVVAATPIMGGHYVSDLLGAVVVSALCIVIVESAYRPLVEMTRYGGKGCRQAIERLPSIASHRPLHRSHLLALNTLAVSRRNLDCSRTDRSQSRPRQGCAR